MDISNQSAQSGTGQGEFDITPVQIGVVHTGAKERRDVERGGSRAEIEVFEPFWPALDQIEHNSHLFVLGWFHRADRTILKTRPRKVAPFAHERGVFASRSPDRPNPVAVTIVPLLERRAGSLIVADLDFIDGTPVIDIKPYCPGWDSVFSAVHRRRANPALQSDEILREFYRRDFVNHVGRAFQGSRLEALSAEACLAATRFFECDPRTSDLKVTLFVGDACPPDGLLDGLMAITGASLANGRLSLCAAPSTVTCRRIAFERGGRTLALQEAPGAPFWETAK